MMGMIFSVEFQRDWTIFNTAGGVVAIPSSNCSKLKDATMREGLDKLTSRHTVF